MPNTVPKFNGRALGWRPDVPDPRDWKYMTPAALVEDLPPRTNNRVLCPPRYEQEAVGSCTAQTGCGMWEFLREKQRLDHWTPARLFLYYNTRLREGNESLDSGAMIRTMIKSMAAEGVCDEKFWPYDGREFCQNPRLTMRPDEQCYVEAERNQVLVYQRIPRNLNAMKACLVEGFPFALGFAVCDSFDRAGQTGVMPIPTAEEQCHGGHAVWAVDYDDDKPYEEGGKGMFLIQNSWGTRWGQDGFFWMPYPVLMSGALSSDFWTIKLVE